MAAQNAADLDQIARQLHEGRLAARPVDFVTSMTPKLTWSAARHIARACDELRVADGETQIGWKLGWTSEAMRAALGIDRPNWGTLWDSQMAVSELPLDRFIHPKVEPELVWRSPVELRGEVDAAEVEMLSGQWALGLEVVDPRFPSFNFQALDNTADNSSSAAIRLGAFSKLDGDPAEVAVRFSNSKNELAGMGSQAMGSPWEAIAWLVRSLAEENLAVREGDIIFTGGLTAPFDVVAGEAYELGAAGFLDPATLRFV